MAARYVWPDDATLLLDLDLRRGVRDAGGDVPLLDHVQEALSKALVRYDVEVKQNGQGAMLALRWPVDDYTIELLAQGVFGAISDKPWDSLAASTRNYWLREARRFAEYGLQAVQHAARGEVAS